MLNILIHLGKMFCVSALGIACIGFVRVNLSTHKGDKGRPDLFTADTTYGAYA